MCTITATDIQNDGKVLSTAISNLAVLLSKSDPGLAANLSAASATLLAITSTWQAGSPVADFNDAATAVEDILALVPQTSSLVPFIEIVVTALDILIANIPTSKVATVVSTTTEAPLPSVSGGSPDADPTETDETTLGPGITVGSVKASQAAVAAHAQAHPNPFRDKIAIQRHHFQAPRDAFKQAWNSEVDKSPTLGINKF